MSCGCIWKIWQAWVIINTLVLGSCSSKLKITGMPSIQATDLPRCGSRSGRICKTTKPSTWKYGLWYEVPGVMYWWQLISPILWMQWKGLSSIHVDTLQSCGKIFCRICKPPSHPDGGEECDARCKWPWMGCHSFDMSCRYMGKILQAWNIPHTCGYPQSRTMTTKVVDEGFTGSANHHAIPSDVLNVMKGTGGTWKRCEKWQSWDRGYN